jgi:membrane protein
MAMSRPRRRSYSRRDLIARVAERSLAEFAGDHCAQFAASISYHVLFSLFPLAIVLAAVFGIVVRATGVQGDVIDAIIGALPLSGSGEQQLRSVLSEATGSLSTLGLLGLVGVVYSASGMMAAVRIGVNAAFDVDETRPFLKGKLIDVGLVGVAALAGIASLGLTIAVRFLGGRAPADGQVDWGGGWASWVLGVLIPLCFSFAIAFGVYRFIPPVHVRTRHVWPVALGVACVFVAAENLFAIYVRNFANYNAIYGSLGAVIAFMFFVYLCALLLLLGAEVASEWPRAVVALQRGDVEQGPPVGVQVRELLRGLWVRRRRDEGRRERLRSTDGEDRDSRA